MEQHERGKGGSGLPYRTVVLRDPTLKVLGGFVQVPNFILKSTQLSLGARLAYAVLLSYAWQDDFCFPAQEALARDLGVHRTNLHRYLRELRDAGLISWKRRGLTQPNIYYIEKIRKGPGGPPDVAKSLHQEVAFMSDQDVAKSLHKEYSKKNTQHTRSVFPKIPRREEGSQPLLEYFRQQAGHTTAQKPLKKELQQAHELLTAHGEAKATWIVRFALQSATETNFRMRHFGAVLSYVPEALAAYDSELARREREETTARRRADEERQLEAERIAWQRMTPEERLEKDLERSLQVFPIKHRREPGPADVERPRSELADKYGLATEASGDAARA